MLGSFFQQNVKMGGFSKWIKYSLYFPVCYLIWKGKWGECERQIGHLSESCQVCLEGLLAWVLLCPSVSTGQEHGQGWLVLRREAEGSWENPIPV